MNTVNYMSFNTSLTAKNGNFFKIAIRLSDPCKNGHNDFSITGEIYEKNKPHTDRYSLGMGAIGDTIVKNFPQYAIFNKLHLCDFAGAPMYAVGNGFYHLKNSTAESFIDYCRVTPAEYEKLKVAEDEEYFQFILESLYIPKRWFSEAQEAILLLLLLEEWTNSKFVDNSTKRHFTPLTAETVAKVQNRIDTGYYTPENIEKRRRAKNQAIKEKQFEEIAADRDKAISKANQEYAVKAAVLKGDLPLNNFIYYTHSNKGVFNWKDYDKKVTQDQFDAFITDVDYSLLSVGITFEMK